MLLFVLFSTVLSKIFYIKLSEFEDQGKLYLICLLGNMQGSSVASEGQY